MTVVIQDGRLQAAATGDVRSPEITRQHGQPGVFQAGLLTGPGQTVEVVDVPDGLNDLVAADPNALMTELTSVLIRRGLL